MVAVHFPSERFSLQAARKLGCLRMQHTCGCVECRSFASHTKRMAIGSSFAVVSTPTTGMTDGSRPPSPLATPSSTPRPRSPRALAPPLVPTVLAVLAAAKFLESSSSAVAPSPSRGLLRDPWSQSRPARVIPRSPPCSRWPISAFTMPETGVHDGRSRCSRCRDLSVHDAPIPLFTIGRFPHDVMQSVSRPSNVPGFSCAMRASASNASAANRS